MNSASAALNSRNQWHHAAMSFLSDGMVYLDGEIMASKASYKGGLGSSSRGANKEPRHWWKYSDKRRLHSLPN